MLHQPLKDQVEVGQDHWGPALTSDKVLFRLWAPQAEQVDLAKGWSRQLAMCRQADGWWQIATDAVGVGDPYAFVIDKVHRVPDPASRCQVRDPHGSSVLVDPSAFRWQTSGWRGRPWHEAVIYELHVGTFTQAGCLDTAADRLDHLADVGVTAVELMPLAQFSGHFGWGYDGVLPFAVHRSYGGGDALKRFVDRAHQLGLMVLLDVVYNHFGPDGNYLPLYATDFFDPARRTPWGAGIDFTRPQVRQFFIQNAAYWIGEYRLDGLRLDAINQIAGQGGFTLLEEIAHAAREAAPERHVHLCTEDERNITRLHRRNPDGTPSHYTAEWNDDFHHVAHVAATGETFGYYQDYAENLPARLVRVLSSGFDYQGTHSAHLDAPRGEPSGYLPPTAFVDFIQNHDQVGNRALGERLSALAPPEAVEALTAILLLSPHVPMLFMGEEFDEQQPFLFFAGFTGKLADAVRKGRRAEFRYWPALPSDGTAAIPDPCDPATFEASRLDWSRLDGPGAARFRLVRRLLGLRRTHVVPRIGGLRDGAAQGAVYGGCVAVSWRLEDGSELAMLANITPTPQTLPARAIPIPGRWPLFETHPELAISLQTSRRMPAWSVVWILTDAE